MLKNQEIKPNLQYPKGETTYWLEQLGWLRGVRLKAGFGQRTVPASGTLFELLQIPKIPKHRVRYWRDFRMYTSTAPQNLDGFVMLTVDQINKWSMQAHLAYQTRAVPKIELFQPENSKATIYLYLVNSTFTDHYFTFGYNALEFHDDWDFGRGTGLDNPATLFASGP